MTTKKAFSFVEVLISVVLLFIALLALLKFDAFVKKDLENSIEKNTLLMLTNAYNFTKETETKNMNDIFTFTSLSDEERKLLKNIKIEVKRLDQEILPLYNSGEYEYELKVDTMKYSKDDTSVIFYRVNP